VAISKQMLEQTINYYEEIERQIEREREVLAAKLVPMRDDQAEIIGGFVDAGGNKRAIKALLRQRALERKAEGLRDKLPDADKDDLDTLKLKLGVLADMPLGMSALAAHEGVSH
jgi:hypothetical protein